jgi:hypothetical protein
MIPEDIPKLQEIHGKSPMKYDVLELDGANLLTALVVCDDEDSPHVMLAAERVAEMVLIMDHEWESPAFRNVALGELHRKIAPIVLGEGISSAYAFLGPDVPRGYDKRLYALGARQMIWRCVKWIAGGE